MTTTSAGSTGSEAAGARSRQRGVRWLALFLVVVVIAAAGLLLVRSQSVLLWLGRTVILEGQVHSGEDTVSIETDDWTYGMSPVGVSWTDAGRSWHEAGRPACLPPGDHTSMVRFAAIQVSVDGMTWRPIVWVDCRGTTIDGAAAGSGP